MRTLPEILQSYSLRPIPILDVDIPLNKYVPLDLSVSNRDLRKIDITDHHLCQAYIDTMLKAHNGKVAYGGYLEQRNLYGNNNNFYGAVPRNIHLGIDFWTKAGTKVMVPISGKVHSFRNNTTVGDYGPTIILEHKLEGLLFHTLYGHLSVGSLRGLYKGQEFLAGSVLATLGTPDINVNYAPHLHFQIIEDLEGNYGDYPGVCALDKLHFYTKNCPDPNFLLHLELIIHD